MIVRDPSSLKYRALIGLGSIVSGQGFGAVIRLAGNLITTRLLLPELFGIMAVFSTIALGLQLLSDAGIRQSIIRSPNAETAEFRKTAWTLQVLRGVFLLFLCLAIAVLFRVLQMAGLTPAETVYDEAVLPIVVGLGGLTLLLRGLLSINILYAQRSVQFGRNVVFGLLVQILGTGSVIVWALIDPTIWALVGGTIIGGVLSVILSYMMFPVVSVAVGWDRQAGIELGHMARWLILSSAFGFVARYGDTLLLGLFLSTTGLGYFAIANMLVSALMAVFSKVQEVWLASLSEIARTSNERLKNVYYRIRMLQDPALVAAYLIIASQGDRIVDLLYDDRYLETGKMVQILALGILVQVYDLQVRLLIVARKQDQIWKKTATEALVTLTINVWILTVMPMSYALVAIAAKSLWGLWLPFRELYQLRLIRPFYELGYLVFMACAVGFTIWSIGSI